MLSALDPLGLLLATPVLPGRRADDLLYIPAITQVREGLGQRGLLYIGDYKNREMEHGEGERIAESYERLKVLTAEMDGQAVIWNSPYPAGIPTPVKLTLPPSLI